MFGYDFNMKIKLIILLTLFLVSSISYAANYVGRLGIGMANNIESGINLLSVKIQRNRSSALGGHFGIDSSSDGVYYALGGKYYKYIYEEPQLNFYSAIAGTFFTYEDEAGESDSGYQFDGTFGAEYSFQGLESIGFSFEFGMGMSNYNDKTRIKTIGYNMIVSAVHFYL